MAKSREYGHRIRPPRPSRLVNGAAKTYKRERRVKEIVVYLDDYVYGKGNAYQTLYLDFRTENDFAAFKGAIGDDDGEIGKYLKNREEGYLEITNYHSSKRLTLGAYYALNVRLLKRLKAEPHRDKRLLLLSYNLEGSADKLLLPHGPLEPDMPQYDEPQKPELPDCFLCNGRLTLNVNDVGQANWNEIIAGNKTALVYDMGAPINASIYDVRNNYIAKYAKSYQQHSPWLIISHWDKDHIHGLCIMSDAELKCFAGVICPFNMRSVVSKRLFARLKNVVGIQRMFSYKNRQRDHRFKYPRLHKIYENKGIWLFLGEDSRNINYSGIVMVVSGNISHAVLTGDCLNVQACFATRYSRFIGGAAKGHVLVVPHHGGKFPKHNIFNYFRLSSSTYQRKAIASVGKGNIYKHPDENTISFFNSIMCNPVERTDQMGCVKEPLGKDILEDYIGENYFTPECVQGLL